MKAKILVVDLGVTLLKNDILFERVCAAVYRDWRNLLLAIVAMAGGRAYVKRQLAGASLIDPATLPYNDKVIKFIKDWREMGGRTALVDTSNHGLAGSIAAHLGIFDETHVPEETLNLKGEEKGVLLEARFGNKGFAYMGNARADLPIWKRSSTAITVNASASLRREVGTACEKVEHLSTHGNFLESYLKALRPHQWLKNFLAFLPMLAAHQFDRKTLLLSLGAFISFCLIASSVYVLNDLLDLPADRIHPRKKNRPFASGSIPISQGMWMLVGLFILGGLTANFIGPDFLLTMTAYALVTTAYSLHLKRRMVIDIFVLAGLYTSRIVAGGVATDIRLSVWLLAFAIFFFLSLASVKRQAELIDSAERGSLQPSGRGYIVGDLPIISMIAIAAGYMSVLVLALYINSATVTELYKRPQALWGVCAMLLYWITRTIMVAHRGNMNDDPLIYAAKDPVSLTCLLISFGLVFLGTTL